MAGFATPLLAQAPQEASNAALYTFLLYTLAVFGIAWLSNRLLQKKSFLSEYFLGSRSLGMWAFALTFAATSSSGGSFTGFPAKIYTHGWVLALWIASYMVVPLCAMGLLGKRINHVARISGSITVPDVIRDRFQNAAFGLLATLLIVFFMTVNLVAQFKAGSLILMTLLRDVDMFQATARWDIIAGVDSQYLVCLLTFGLAVVIYTTYGGFHAVVWTDVMQGIVMVGGVILMLPLALAQVGGMEKTTRRMEEMTPPRVGTLTVSLAEPAERRRGIAAGTWFAMPKEEYLQFAESWAPEQIARLEERAAAGRISSEVFERRSDRLSRRRETVRDAPDHILFRVAEQRAIQIGKTEPMRFDPETNAQVPDPPPVVELTTPWEIHDQLQRLQKGIGSSDPSAINGDYSVSQPRTLGYLHGAGEPGHYVTGPGPSNARLDGFLPFSLAVSFFFMWAISGAGQPSSMVRLMAFNNSQTFRRAIFTVAIYYTLIYFPLVVIFCCARVLIPGMDSTPDAIMPETAVHLTKSIGQLWLAGLLVAAPFAAIMSTVDSFLLMISSALVRDVYQRNINPDVSEKNIKRLSYLCTLLIGLGAMAGAVNPPQFLQDIIVYCGSGLAACFLGPMVFALYWPRVNAWGATAGMLFGFGSHLAMYIAGRFVNGSFAVPLTLLGFNPVVVGLVVSFAAVLAVSLITPPPPEPLVTKYFRERID